MSTSNSACEYCNRKIIHPFRGGQRFCCEACSDAWLQRSAGRRWSGIAPVACARQHLSNRIAGSNNSNDPR
jgi:hypothetical protein